MLVLGMQALGAGLGLVKVGITGLAGLFGGAILPILAIAGAIAAVVAQLDAFNKNMDEAKSAGTVGGQQLAVGAAGAFETPQEFNDAMFSELQAQEGDFMARYLWGTMTFQTALAEARDEYFAVGTSAVEGLAGGLNNTEPANTAASEMANSLIETTRAALGSHSPSLVFAELGLSILQGLSMGLYENMGLVSEPMSALQTTLDTGWKTIAVALAKHIPELIKPLNALEQEFKELTALALAAGAAIGAVAGATMGGGAGIPGRASGGPVSANTPYMVGERGPELFVPGRGGSIVPNGKLGGGNTYVLNAYGESPHELLRMLKAAAGESDA
jgi:hypothetical protein